MPYEEDPSPLFRTIAHLPGAAWIDSGRPGCKMGRYDILSALPSEILTAEQKPGHMTPFEYVEAARARLPCVDAGETPFAIGLLGYFTYEANNQESQKPKLLDNPDFIWGVYYHSLVIDHEQKSSTFYYWQDDQISKGALEILQRIQSSGESSSTGKLPAFQLTKLNPVVSQPEYQLGFNRVINHIHLGDCYQVNYTMPNLGQFSGDSYPAYESLRSRLPSPFSAFLRFGRDQILSFSPERFILKSSNQVVTAPIKGTLPRGENREQDQNNAALLRQSAKDKAENLMIVDLLRNDLSKNALQGSVKVKKLFELQSFANVHHLVSTIACEISNDTPATKVLADAWPGGSITGAPKKRAMQIIEDIEPYRRGVYCGSVGYLSSNGRMDTNIAIRTIACCDDQLVCWSGGGIVADSEGELEYREAIGKINTILEGLTQFDGSPSTSK
ncbi:aminodeoxychorismate synthase component I [Halioxenophilus sp. WMMB6]|uniref:aminodeoxychorismate synthase component I n=1 Tax=Halioxenophilus sp. WMMB6 TaxID=3073815 RepID=UPI00295F20EF|nr:aminodeoxychorismate synthase component I [Halioxenophilus sp. WMMB6]